jgi:hypothetical protein
MRQPDARISVERLIVVLLAMSYEMTRDFRIADLPRGFTLIVDESHYVKNPRSERSQAVRLFSDRAEPSAAHDGYADTQGP